MKTSILIPSLDRDYLLQLLPQIMLPNTEVVVCSPTQPPNEKVFWVLDQKMEGNNPANRQAFDASTGDVIVCIPDDITLEPGWLDDALALLEPRDCVVSLTPPQSCTCFGLLYANCPVATRETVERHWDRFYPYRAHWGDVAFSLSVWQSGGKVIETRRRLVRFRDRKGHSEAPTKALAFASDCEAFLDHFPDLAKKWMRENWRLFNKPVA